MLSLTLLLGRVSVHLVVPGDVIVLPVLVAQLLVKDGLPRHFLLLILLTQRCHISSTAQNNATLIHPYYSTMLYVLIGKSGIRGGNCDLITLRPGKVQQWLKDQTTFHKISNNKLHTYIESRQMTVERVKYHACEGRGVEPSVWCHCS